MSIQELRTRYAEQVGERLSNRDRDGLFSSSARGVSRAGSVADRPNRSPGGAL